MAKYHQIDIVTKMAKFFDEHGKLPSTKELKNMEDLPSPQTVAHHFGNIKKAKEATLNFLAQQGKIPGQRSLLT